MKLFEFLNEDHGDEEERFVPETFILKAGTRVYHGTNGSFDERHLSAPCWVSDDPEPAKYFATWHGDEGQPRIATYVVTRDVKLAVMTKHAFDEIEYDYNVTYYGVDEADEYLSFLKQLGFEGWHIGDNYGPAQADILLSDTNCLRHETTTPLGLQENYIKPRRRDLYLYGHCFRLALAIHDKTGWPLVGIRAYGSANPDFSLIDHAGVRMPDGRILDSRGAMDDQGFLDGMLCDGGGAIEVVDLDRPTVIDLIRHAGDARYDRLPDSVVERDAERLINRFGKASLNEAAVRVGNRYVRQLTSRSQLMNLLNKSSYSALRGWMCQNGDVWVWDAQDFSHKAVSNLIPHTMRPIYFWLNSAPDQEFEQNGGRENVLDCGGFLFDIWLVYGGEKDYRALVSQSALLTRLLGYS